MGTDLAWRPLLGGADAAAAWDTIHDTAAALGARTFDEPSPSSGAAGAALFFAYLSVAPLVNQVAGSMRRCLATARAVVHFVLVQPR
jgi:hypothetical protein